MAVFSLIKNESVSFPSSTPVDDDDDLIGASAVTTTMIRRRFDCCCISGELAGQRFNCCMTTTTTTTTTMMWLLHQSDDYDTAMILLLHGDHEHDDDNVDNFIVASAVMTTIWWRLIVASVASRHRRWPSVLHIIISTRWNDDDVIAASAARRRWLARSPRWRRCNCYISGEVIGRTGSAGIGVVLPVEGGGHRRIRMILNHVIGLGGFLCLLLCLLCVGLFSTALCQILPRRNSTTLASSRSRSGRSSPNFATLCRSTTTKARGHHKSCGTVWQKWESLSHFLATWHHSCT